MLPVFDQAEQLLTSLIHGGGDAPWLHDWSAYSSQANWSDNAVSVAAGGWQTFVNISGSGWLTWVRGWSSTTAADNPDIRVTVDGVPIVFTGQTPATGHTLGNDVWHPIHFKASLKVEVRNRHTSAANLGCNWTYLLQTATPKVGTQRLISMGSRLMADGWANGTSFTDVINVTGSGWLLGVTFSARYSGSSLLMYGYVETDGSTRMQSRGLVNPGLNPFKMHTFSGPLRFNNNLRIQHRTDTAGVEAMTRVWYALD